MRVLSLISSPTLDPSRLVIAGKEHPVIQISCEIVLGMQT